MTLPTDAEVERLARSYCVAKGLDPDFKYLGLKNWQAHANAARDFLIMARCAKAGGLV
jgi:hypothetical protein